MLFTPKDGELRVYRNKKFWIKENDIDKLKKESKYLKILFYQYDFDAPLFDKGWIYFSCGLTDNYNTQKLIEFFSVYKEVDYVTVEYLWSGHKNFGKRYRVEIKRSEGFRLMEDKECLRFYFSGEVVKSDFITEFSDGNEFKIK